LIRAARGGVQGKHWTLSPRSYGARSPYRSKPGRQSSGGVPDAKEDADFRVLDRRTITKWFIRRGRLC
jgi:hypothetical protein